VRTGSFPNDLISKIRVSKYPVHHDLDVVARRRVAVQVDGARRLQDFLHAAKARNHVYQVRHERRVHLAQRIHPQLPEFYVLVVHPDFAEQEGDRAGDLLLFLVHGPRVAEGLDLLRHRLPGHVAVHEVVVPVGVERRVEVNQIDAARVDLL
jgi:hypothetical protein